jgi:hypothetical protein
MKEEELPDWIKDIEETAPIDETTVPVELAVMKKLPPLPSEPLPERTEEQPLEVATGEIETIEAQSSESDWTPEEEPQQPTAEEVLETEADTTFPVEQPVIPSVEIPAAEISTLEDARNAINNGSPEQAAEVYSGMIKHNLHLEEIIKDVQEALYRYPVDINLWVVLGDAHLRTDDLQDALDAYSKAEDLVR